MSGCLTVLCGAVGFFLAAIFLCLLVGWTVMLWPIWATVALFMIINYVNKHLERDQP